MISCFDISRLLLSDLWYNPSMLKIKNDLGEIRFSENVIKKIATDAVHACGGKVYIYHHKGKYQNAMSGIGSRMTLYNGDHGDPGSIEIEDGEEGLRITVYIVVKFGAHIRKTCIGILEGISGNVERVMGEKPLVTKVIVTGIESNEIARRNLEYSIDSRVPDKINEPS